MRLHFCELSTLAFDEQRIQPDVAITPKLKPKKVSKLNP